MTLIHILGIGPIGIFWWTFIISFVVIQIRKHNTEHSKN
jgi:hypothetical protein